MAHDTNGPGESTPEQDTTTASDFNRDVDPALPGPSSLRLPTEGAGEASQAHGLQQDGEDLKQTEGNAATSTQVDSQTRGNPGLSALHRIATGPAEPLAPAIGSPLDEEGPILPLAAVSGASTEAVVLLNIIRLDGARHPFKIDERYLRRRNVVKDDEAEGTVDPYTISIYTLKELIWRDWRDEWESRPTTPGAIRLIFFGKLLEDKQNLKDVKFKSGAPNAVHMSVRPQEFLDEEENAKQTKSGKGSARGTPGEDEDGDTEAGCCRCLVM